MNKEKIKKRNTIHISMEDIIRIIINNAERNKKRKPQQEENKKF